MGRDTTSGSWGRLAGMHVADNRDAETKKRTETGGRKKKKRAMPKMLSREKPHKRPYASCCPAACQNSSHIMLPLRSMVSLLHEWFRRPHTVRLRLR